MPNDVPDWTAQTKANLVGGISNLNLGDVGAPSLSPDQATETITSGGGPLLSASMVLASFKAAVAATIAVVGSLGAVTQGSNTSVSPTFGQAPTAGNLLVAWVTASTGEPTTGQAGWVKVKSFTQDSPWAAIWAKPNAAGGDAAPTFTSPGGSTTMHAQLGEFSGVATISPTDQTAQAGANGLTSLNPAATVADVGFGDLVVICSRWALTNPATATFSQTVNNGATFVHAGDTGGTSYQRQSSFNYAIIPAATVAQPLGVADWAYDATGTNEAVPPTASSVVLAATPGKTYTAASISGSLASIAAQAAAHRIQLKDGATVKWSQLLAIPATSNSNAIAEKTPCAYKGTQGNSMTLAFDGGEANVLEDVNIGAYLR